MRSPPKALLGVPDPYRGKLSPTRPFDDLLIKSHIKVGLVMVMAGKVYFAGTYGSVVRVRA